MGADTVYMKGVCAPRTHSWSQAMAILRLSMMVLLITITACYGNDADDIVPPAGPSSIIQDQYIVVFAPDAGDAASAAAILLQQITNSAAAATMSDGASAVSENVDSTPGSTPSAEFVRALGAGRDPNSNSSSSSPLDASETDAAPAVSALGIQAAVVRASAAALPYINNSSLVAAVLQDRIITTAQAPCVQQQYLATGISITPSSSFKWPNCININSKLVWFGRACAPGKILYTEIRALNRITGRLLSYGGKACVLRPSSNNALYNYQRFGGCGIAPSYAKGLPTLICSATGGGGSGTSPPPPPPAASPAPPPAPTSPAPQNTLYRMPVLSGEEIPTGVLRIEAVKVGSVIDMSRVPTQQQVVLGVVDSGIDSTHPDLNYIGGVSWVQSPAAGLASDSVYPGWDSYGHGTAVAGVAAARNNGQGVVGVVPDLAVYSLKVLDGLGQGSLSDALDAMKWAAGPEGQAKGIKVINLSIIAMFNTTATDYSGTYAYVCAFFKEASDAGIVVTAAAGNYGMSMRGVLPANCPTVIAVTAMDGGSNSPASFSNWLPADAPAAEQATVIAAPGIQIKSTLSYAKDASGYRSLSGTSLAAPHVAGVAAACIMSGACAAGTGADKVAMLQAAAQERLTMAGVPAYGFSGDASNVQNGKYYGNLVWEKY